MYVSPDQTRIFRRQRGPQVLNAAIGTVIGGVAAVIATRIIATGTDLRTPVQLAIFAGLFLFITALVWYRTLVISNLSVTVTPSVVEITRPGKTVHRWDRATTTFGSHILKESTNGIRTGTTRSLVAKTEITTDKVALPGISAERFSLLIALLSPIVPEQQSAVLGQNGYQLHAPQAPTAAGYLGAAAPNGYAGVHPSVSTREFALNAGKLRGSGLIGVIVFAVLAIIPLVIAVIIWPDDASTAVTFAGFSVLIAAVAVIVLLRLVFVMRRIPTRIVVDSAGVTVGERRFAFLELSSIRVTPVTYVATGRVLVLTGPDGRSTRYSLGGRSGGDRQALALFPLYGQFVDALAAATGFRPGLLSFDLQ